MNYRTCKQWNFIRQLEITLTPALADVNVQAFHSVLARKKNPLAHPRRRGCIHTASPPHLPELFTICMWCKVCAIAMNIFFFPLMGLTGALEIGKLKGCLMAEIIEQWKCQLCLIAALFFTFLRIQSQEFSLKKDLNKNQWMSTVWVWLTCFFPDPYHAIKVANVLCLFSIPLFAPPNLSKNKTTFGPWVLNIPEQDWENRSIEHKQNAPRSASRKRLLEVSPTIQK